MELRRSTATHKLYICISAIQMEPRRCIATHKLGHISVIHREPRRYTATHSLDGVSYHMEPRRCTATYILDIGWIICVINLKFFMQLSYYLLYAMFRICLSITVKLLPFPPYHLHNQNIIKCVWCHTHILNIWINLVTNIGSWYLHPEISVVTIFPSSGRSGLSHDSSWLQLWLQKMYSTYIPENSNVQTKMQSCKSSPPCSFECSYL